MTEGLAGKVALVTGSSRGIGRSIALRLAASGVTIALNSSQDVSRTQAELKATGVDCNSYIADISQPQAVERLVADVLSDLGSIDIVVNNAGINRDALLMRISNEDWDDVLNTNLKGSFLCIRAAVRHMIKNRWGRIINIGSVVGLRGNPGQASYTAAKAGLVGLTRTAAKEVASRGITVNVVTPGFIHTEMTAKLNESQQELIKESVPMRRFGSPADVAGAVVFLVSDQASYITGQVIPVDGGLALV